MPQNRFMTSIFSGIVMIWNMEPVKHAVFYTVVYVIEEKREL